MGVKNVHIFVSILFAIAAVVSAKEDLPTDYIEHQGIQRSIVNNGVNTQDCPQSFYKFPYTNRVSDYIRIKKPLPNLEEYTFCFRKSFTRSEDYILSYANDEYDNAILFSVGIEVLEVTLNGVKNYVPDFRLTVNRVYHICVATFAKSTARSYIFIDGELFHLVTTYNPSTIKGNGIMIIGQNQHEVGGDFIQTEGILGEIYNFMMWDRILEFTEIADLFSQPCSCASNQLIDLAEPHVELFGSVISQMTDTCDLEALYGTNCQTVQPKDYVSGDSSSGIYQINVSRMKLQVYCDLKTDGGGWTVIQRRQDGSVNFYRNYADYVNGFGQVSGEFWIGLNNIYNIMIGKKFELRIDMEDWSGEKKFAKYSLFSIGKPSEEYILRISGYSGNAGDSFADQNNRGFSTKDHDVDAYNHGSKHCAQDFMGAWWYNDCHESNLNGIYYQGGPHDSFADGVNWKTWKGYHYSLKFVEMKIRPTSF